MEALSRIEWKHSQLLKVTPRPIGLKKLRLLDSLILTGVLYDGGVGGSPRLTNYLRVSTNYLRPAAGRKFLGLI